MGYSKTVALSLFLYNALLQVNCKLVDMSFPYENNMVSWPGLLAFNLTLSYRGSFHKAPFMIAFDMKLNEHSGTHMDAPVHFAEGKATVDQIPPEDLIAQAIVVNITEQVLKERDYQLTVDDLKSWEKKHGVIPDGSIVFVLTGVGKYWGDYEKYMGAKKTNATSAGKATNFHWPGN